MKEQRKRNRKRWFAILLSVVFCFTLLPATAMAATVKTQAEMNAYVNAWNVKTNPCYLSDKTTSTDAGSPSGCAAFSRSLFVKIYGHTDQEGNKNNTVTRITCKSNEELTNAIKTKAKPGDALRVSYTGNGGHIMHLWNYDSNTIHVYESNRSDGSMNKATYTPYKNGEQIVKDAGLTKCKKNSDAFERSIVLTIISSKKNPNTSGTNSNPPLPYKANSSSLTTLTP